MDSWWKYGDEGACLVTKRDVIGLVLIGSILTAALVFSDSHALIILTEASSSPWFLLLIFVVYLFRPFFGWPHGIFPTAIGFIYGFRLGLIIGLIGGIVTVLPLYIVGRYFKTTTGLLAKASEVSDRFFTTTGETRGVIGARLTPLPTDVVAYAAGIAGVRIHSYLIGMFVGGIPWVIGFVYIGAAAQTLNIDTAQIPPSSVLLLATLGVFLLLGYPIFQKMRKDVK
ncbi:TVP38/TMEM64 family protein [Natrialba sp. SSL1]|uniref:TVP38/TMEM64 family protein n=1 Tax=Natrialba sp. SSL1 TaxID=1869245 RepID=UPI0009FED11A|nr:VTT domain-containing protein [Natrialba sp. SSL1]